MSVIFKTYQIILKIFSQIGINKSIVTKIFFFIYDNFIGKYKPIKVFGNKMYIGSLSKSIISRSLLLNRVYEGIETNLFMELVKEGMTVIDIGANIGYYSLIAGKIVGKMGKVYAFEPEPNNYNLLVKNIKKNKLSNIVALQKAVSVDSGEKTLFLSKLAHDHSFTEENVNSIRDERGSIKVETISIDEFAQQELIKKLDIVKIDVEGAILTPIRSGHTEIVEVIILSE